MALFEVISLWAVFSATPKNFMGFLLIKGNMKKKWQPNFFVLSLFSYSFVCCMNKNQFQSKKQFGLLSGDSLLKLFWPEFFHFWNILTYLGLDVCRATYSFFCLLFSETIINMAWFRELCQLQKIIQNAS